tara:strand:- start:489 stop:734 length:246 start_codon:yes stop_codon:yes gene_type:complete
MNWLKMIVKSGKFLRMGKYMYDNLDEILPTLHEGVDLLGKIAEAKADDGKIDVSEAAEITPEAQRILAELFALMDESEKAK